MVYFEYYKIKLGLMRYTRFLANGMRRSKWQ